MSAFPVRPEKEAQLAQRMAALRGTRRANENQPVLVAGDREQEQLATRRRDGIPLSEEMSKTMRWLGEAVGVPCLLDR